MILPVACVKTQLVKGINYKAEIKPCRTGVWRLSGLWRFEAQRARFSSVSYAPRLSSLAWQTQKKYCSISYYEMHVASIAERHNYAECYTQEIINEVRISFAYSRFATTCHLGGQYNIFFFLQEFTERESRIFRQPWFWHSLKRKPATCRNKHDDFQHFNSISEI